MFDMKSMHVVSPQSFFISLSLLCLIRMEEGQECQWPGFMCVCCLSSLSHKPFCHFSVTRFFPSIH